MKVLPGFRPSPALVIACAALLVALGDTGWATVKQLVPRNSVGTAQLRANAVTSAKIRNGAVAVADLAPAARRPGPAGPAGAAGPQGPAGPAGAVTRLWAVVNASGSLARSAGATSSGRLGPGSYEVIFNQNVTDCVYVSSVGGAGTDPGLAGYASVARRAGSQNAVRVDTRSGAANLADRGFHVLVVC